MPKLVLQGVPGGEVEYRLRPTVTVLGRKPGLDVVLDHDSISRTHARIEFHDDAYFLLDLGSTNGTFHKGKRVRRARLEEGDALTLGELAFRFSEEDVRGLGGRFNPLRGLSRILEGLTEPAAVDVVGPGGGEGGFSGILDDLRKKSARWESAYRQLTVLYRISHQLQSTAPLKERLEGAVKLAIGTLKAERGFLFEYDPDEDDLEPLVALARTAEGASMIDWVRAVSRRAVDGEEAVASGPGLSIGQTMTRPPSGRVFVVAPLTSQRGSHGALYLDGPSSEVGWGKEEVEFVTTLAAQVGATLDNEHYARQMIERSEIARELAIAREIQTRLLPENLEGVEGFEVHGRSRSSRDVGGDYYDAFPLGDRGLASVVVDVSGKGVPAALVQAQVRAHLRSAAGWGAPLEEIMEQLNATLLADHEGGMYITAVLALPDPSRDVLRFVRAGHAYPHVLPGDGGPVRTLEAGDRPCGIFEGSPFVVHEVPFAPGDALVLATDGFEDAENTQGERFGAERYLGLLEEIRGRPPAEAVDRAFALLDAFAEEAPQFDDATLLVLRRTR